MRELAMLVAVAACGSSGAAPDARTSDGTDAIVPFDPGPEPTQPLLPVFGELTIEQLDLPIGITASIGEAAIIVGPDGTLVLLDIGNRVHDDLPVEHWIKIALSHCPKPT